MSVIKNKVLKEETNKNLKKWCDTEIIKILDYLEDNRKFEKPTAQIYYKQFLEESKITATWELVKWKDRYLKTCFVKAEAWRKKTGVGILEKDLEQGIETVNVKLNKVCNHYDRLKNIFGEKVEAETELFDSFQSSVDIFGFLEEEEDTQIRLSSPSQSLNTPTVINLDERPSSSVLSTEKSKQSFLNASTDKVSDLVGKLKRPFPKDSISQLTKCQSERNETQRLKLEFEEKKIEKEFEFQKKKFNTEIEIKKQELDLKKYKYNRKRSKNFRNGKNERIAKYEIDLKYKK